MDISLRMKEDFELDKDNIEINKYTNAEIKLLKYTSNRNNDNY